MASRQYRNFGCIETLIQIIPKIKHVICFRIAHYIDNIVGYFIKKDENTKQYCTVYASKKSLQVIIE